MELVIRRYESVNCRRSTDKSYPGDNRLISPKSSHRRGSFYPLSDGISTHYHLITNSYFRICSTCLSRSQAGFCVYTHCAISVRAEPTFERLRYSFGGDRPSQTAHLTLSPNRFHGCWLEPRDIKSGIPTSTPRKLTPMLLCLPPILYRMSRNSVSGYSKAPWGLSV